MPAFRRPHQGKGTAGHARADLGAQLRKWREAADLSQGKLGKACGMTITTISAIENGRISIPPDRMAAMVKALRLDSRQFALVVLSHMDPEVYKLLRAEAGWLSRATL